MFFWILWSFDALISLVVLYFLFDGLGDGSVSSSNSGIWFLMIAGLALIMGGSLWLRSHQHETLAKALLWVLAIPGLIAVLYLLIVVLSKQRWN